MTEPASAALRETGAPAQTTGTTHLLSPYRLGEIELKNRLVMSPMTRSRAVEANTPNALMAEYYAQRASAALIVSEATQISPQGQGYSFIAPVIRLDMSEPPSAPPDTSTGGYGVARDDSRANRQMPYSTTSNFSTNIL